MPSNSGSEHQRPNKTPFPLTDTEILQHHQQLTNSEEFHATEAQRRFLDYVIRKTLAGESDQIKGYTIATRVFGRNDNFDQNTDPIVSIQANKLRRALERYYLTEGTDDPIRIDIPKGSYVPVFYKQPAEAPPLTIPDPMDSGTTSDQTWPTVLIKPFTNLTYLPENDYFGIGLATEISIALSRYQDIRVVMYGDDGNARRASDLSARFVVGGSVRKDEHQVCVNIYMVDTTTNIQIIGESHKIALDPVNIISVEEMITEKIALAIAGEHGAISKTLRQESRAKAPHELSTYEAILKYYEYDMLLTPETFIVALEALTEVCRKEPDCGQIWTMLGRLHADNIVLDFFDTDVTLDEAIGYAAKGVLINPDNQRARVILAAIKMYSDDVTSARMEAEQALSLNPECLFFMDVIGYLLTLLGDFEKGPRILKKALTLNPFNHSFVYYGFWLNSFRTHDYDRAYREALKLSMNGLFWEPLVRASTLGLMGRIDDGRKSAQELLTMKPDFETKGRRLMSYYIKFDEIIDRVIQGLSNVGVFVN